MIVDAHLHLEPELDVDGLLATMDAGGVDRAVLLAAAQVPIGRVGAGAAMFRACMCVASLRRPMIALATRFRPEPYVRPDNEPVFAAAAAHPDRFFPFAFVNPALGAHAHDELDRWVAAGAAGVKLHPWMHGYRLPDAMPILQRCARAGLPVLAHLGEGSPHDVAAVLESLPTLDLILAHAGIPHFERVWALPRVRFDVSSTRTLLPRRIVEALIRAVGPERVLFASDGPVGLRVVGGYAYEPVALPDRAMGRNLLDLFR